MNTPEANRAQIAAVWEAMARGDTAPFADAMADDFIWRMQGTTPWSGTYVGKADVRGRMLRTLLTQFATPYRSVAHRIHADGDFVIVEHQGDVTTKRGEAYNNCYCFVIRMRDGRMMELTEYFDSALVERRLEPPPWA
ncbi:nuclear transport factor 2 family protein [Terricaulis sp.]|uniref:nuclear transport factor 2 family protein n=1 Tax=Terricaulis sp. TaxID=2768686 RepID=UPI0037838960